MDYTGDSTFINDCGPDLIGEVMDIEDIQEVGDIEGEVDDDEDEIMNVWDMCEASDYTEELWDRELRQGDYKW